MQLIVVFNQQEHYVQTDVEDTLSGGKSSLSAELLQAQLLSLTGIAPEDQLLVSDTGNVLASPQTEPSDPLFDSSESSMRLYLQSSSSLEAIKSDWHDTCTRTIFGNIPVVQPAFCLMEQRDTVICRACASTCTTSAGQLDSQAFEDWNSKSKRFISELEIVSGSLNVPPPRGFEKLPYDLNFGASGDHVFLCVKRGGNRAVTRIVVSYETKQEAVTKLPTSFIAQEWLASDCNVGNTGAECAVRIGYDWVPNHASEHATTMAMTDVRLHTAPLTATKDSVATDATGYILIPQNLNYGAMDASHALYLQYSLSPINGFVCDGNDQGHSPFGDCLFSPRRPSNLSSITELDLSRLHAAKTLSMQRIQSDETFRQSRFKQHEPKVLRQLQGGLSRVQSYEDIALQQEALRRIPVERLKANAREKASDPSMHFQDELMRQLLHWFKKDFFTWTNNPNCSACGQTNTSCTRTVGPNAEEQQGQASRVEVYECRDCHHQTRFPRYNSPLKLLETRTGRCGEWANCFTLCCRAMGVEARYVLDVTDHVWTEVYSEEQKKWLHCDACEDKLDAPLTYEVGWGKKLSYIFSFSKDEVVDSAKRYTTDWHGMRQRRKDVSEEWLERTIADMNQKLQAKVSEERRKVLRERWQVEKKELDEKKQVKATEVQGRVSGSAEWKKQRQEDGGTVERKKVEDNRQEGMSMTEITQTLSKNMIVGCGEEDCTNPYCAHYSRRKEEIDETERAAKSLQTIATLGSLQLSLKGFASLVCSSRQDIKSVVSSYSPCIYLPLQDGKMKTNGQENALMADVSGNNLHVHAPAACVLRKPFEIPSTNGSGCSYGMQVLPEQVFTVDKLVPDPVGHSGTLMSALIRFDSFVRQLDVKSDPQWSIQASFTCEQISISFSFSCDGKRSGKWIISDGTGEHEGKEMEVRPGGYAHLGLYIGQDTLVVYVDGTNVSSMSMKSDMTLSPSTKLQVKNTGVGSGFTWSHLALLPLETMDSVERFCDVMSEQFVQPLPLSGYGKDGTRDDKQCDDLSASMISSFRVYRIKLWGERTLEGVQFTYRRLASDESVEVEGKLYGNKRAKEASASPTKELVLYDEEYVTTVRGRSGAWMDALKVETNFRRIVETGGSGGSAFDLPLPQGCQVRSLRFNDGDHLTDPIAFVCDSSSGVMKKSKLSKSLKTILSTSEKEDCRSAVSSVLRYMRNVEKFPTDQKFQRIRASNQFFASTVGNLTPDVQSKLMKWCGFQPKEEGNETFYVLDWEVLLQSKQRSVENEKMATMRRIVILEQIAMDE